MVMGEVSTPPKLPAADDQPRKNRPKRPQGAQDECVESGSTKTGTPGFAGVLRHNETRQIKERGGHDQGNREMGGSSMHFYPKRVVHKMIFPVIVGNRRGRPSSVLVRTRLMRPQGTQPASGESTTASVL